MTELPDSGGECHQRKSTHVLVLLHALVLIAPRVDGNAYCEHWNIPFQVLLHALALIAPLVNGHKYFD